MIIPKIKKILFSSLFLIVLFSPLKFIFAEEKINNFDVEIKINPDSSILVTEIIKYDFDGNQKHGIYRYIPVDYKTNAGNKSTDLDLQSVTMDGSNEKYEVTRVGSNKNIKIGDASSLITGQHVYTIIYKVKRALNYFKDLDELYWNITGNGWDIPIDNVHVSLSLPEASTGKIEISCYQGLIGSKENCLAETKDNLYIANSTRSLSQSEGLTIAFDFPKGIAHEPTKIENIVNFIKDNFIIFLPFLVFIIMFFIWKKYGKDPKGYSVIIAQYEPPVGMKPTLVGSLVDEKPDFRDITAGLIYLAEQGFVKIKRLEKEWILGSIDYEIELLKNDIATLEKTEQSILNLFFDDNLTIGNIKKISEFNQDINFSKKSKEIISNLYEEMVNRGFYDKNPNKVKILYISISWVITFFVLKFSADSIGSIGVISVVLSEIIVIIFGFMMGKKTKLGAETKDYILGFKLFLSVTETNRLDFHNAPEKNPEKFMEFLPYAIALGVEDKWAAQFKDIYITQPAWYQSNVPGNFAAISFVSQISDFSKSTIKSAASGSFGGAGSGSSGGGGGGGGGGSW